MFAMLLDDLGACLLDLTLTKRIRVPCLEAIFLGGGRVSYTLGAMCLENHGLERAGCCRHDVVASDFVAMLYFDTYFAI
jgi:hypothetical protein